MQDLVQYGRHETTRPTTRWARQNYPIMEFYLALAIDGVGIHLGFVLLSFRVGRRLDLGRLGLGFVDDGIRN